MDDLLLKNFKMKLIKIRNEYILINIAAKISQSNYNNFCYIV